MKTMSYNTTRIAVPTIDGIEIYDASEILRCEADKTSSFIHLANGGQVLSTKSLKHFEKILCSCDFLRVHKGNLINIYHIRKYLKGKRSTVILSDSSSVEVASRKKNQLLQIISSFPFTPKPEPEMPTTRLTKPSLPKAQKGNKTMLERKAKTGSAIVAKRKLSKAS